MQKRWFFIGSNRYNESGVDSNHQDDDDWLPLTALPGIIQSASSVYSGYGLTIFANEDLSRLWSAGNNDCGQCCVNSKGEEIKHFTEITYFKRNGIRLKRIFTNPMALAVFFLSDKGALYGAGKTHLLGTESPNKAVAEPIRIDALQNVIDVTTAWYDYSVALCVTEHQNASSIIDGINQWTKSNGMNFPLDISKEIVSFMAVTKVFHTTSGGWKEMKPFVDAQTTITKVVMNGEEQTMLLDGDGNLWEMHRVGFPHDYACGQMPYFSQNGIRIRDIQCGQGHVLALSEDGDVYSWGLNYSGECGASTVCNTKIV